MLTSKNSDLLINSTISFTMFIEWLLLYFVKLIGKYSKNEIGELQDCKVPCDCITGTKFIKTNFSPDLVGKYSTFYEVLPLNFRK